MKQIIICILLGILLIGCEKDTITYPVYPDDPTKICDTITYVEDTFEWKKEASYTLGVDKFGLQWTTNNKTVFANISPIYGSKLYILDSFDYNISCPYDFVFPEESMIYRHVNMEIYPPKHYNDVIVTSYNGYLYVINIEEGGIEGISNHGNIYIIKGVYKRFEYIGSEVK